MLIAAVIIICLVLLALGFLLPRLSRYPQRGVDRTFGAAQRASGKAPGVLGRLLQMPFRNSRRAADESAAAGRKARRKAPV
jgi:Family of unknown function (DUF6411)